MVPSLPPLPSELSVFVKGNPDRKKCYPCSWHWHPPVGTALPYIDDKLFGSFSKIFPCPGGVEASIQRDCDVAKNNHSIQYRLVSQSV